MTRKMLAAGAAALGFLSATSANAAAIYQNIGDITKIAKAVASPALASIAPVPEPATWGMMLLGIGVIGGMMRSQRKPAPAVA
jgi:hypothetical protein